MALRLAISSWSFSKIPVNYVVALPELVSSPDTAAIHTVKQTETKRRRARRFDDNKL